MSDVLDEIIDRLPPSTTKKLLQLNRDSQYYSSNFTHSLNEAQQIKINQIVKDFKRRMTELKSKTAENKNCLSKIKSDLETMKLHKNSDENPKNIKVYLLKIKELEIKIKNLTRHVGPVDLPELFSNVEQLNEEIMECRRKIAEAEEKYKCYAGFPPNIEEAKEIIKKIREEIKHNESFVEAKLM